MLLLYVPQQAVDVHQRILDHLSLYFDIGGVLILDDFVPDNSAVVMFLGRLILGFDVHIDLLHVPVEHISEVGVDVNLKVDLIALHKIIAIIPPMYGECDDLCIGE